MMSLIPDHIMLTWKQKDFSPVQEIGDQSNYWFNATLNSKSDEFYTVNTFLQSILASSPIKPNSWLTNKKKTVNNLKGIQ